ncbi:hypothetical protein ETB97_000424 [Aspergillus alliaceus]|uniref:Uncharacterized protein n=1 Tax=Petromyces alliaceus TaxID=209559 RepID=A0A8H6A251_PETAA|nr:hypothetical protein ETB97_000424 [Aspergillus burnettii]
MGISVNCVIFHSANLFLNYAVDRRMALHFLLAVAHGELSLHYGIGLNLSQESNLRFDQVDYVRTHKVDDFCTNEGLDIFLEASSSGRLPIPDQVLLARIFTYLYDRDGFCSFFWCGGSFATIVNDDSP